MPLSASSQLVSRVNFITIEYFLLCRNESNVSANHRILASFMNSDDWLLFGLHLILFELFCVFQWICSHQSFFISAITFLKYNLNTFCLFERCMLLVLRWSNLTVLLNWVKFVTKPLCPISANKTVRFFR